MNRTCHTFAAITIVFCAAFSAVGGATPPLRDLDGAFEGESGYDDEAKVATVYPAKATNYDFGALKLPERLGLGVIAVRCGSGEVFLTWRYRMDDPRDISYRVYRDGAFVGTTSSCCMKVPYVASKSGGTKYRVVAFDGAGAEISAGEWTVPANAPLGYVSISLVPPPETTTRTNGNLGAQWQGLPVSYIPGDCSAGDLDGDGELEIVLKWDPPYRADNSHAGETGPTWYEAIKLDGRSLWRVYMGPNIRSGEHYSPFLVWDFDGDGKSELVVKTADGTVDGKGNVIGNMVTEDPFDYPTQGGEFDCRLSDGKIQYGNEYLTVFSGEDGRELKSVPYIPAQGSNGGYWAVDYWGDDYFNRSERYLAAVAYLDGTNACAVMCRGYYHRTALTAWRWDGQDLRMQWAFDTTNHFSEIYKTGDWFDYMGEGFHSLRTADIDFDGKDEIIYGSMTVDHDGKGLYSTHLGHGDAMHIVQTDSARRGLQVYVCLEHGDAGVALWEGQDGELLWHEKAWKDTARAMCADCDPDVRGFEYWGANSIGIFDGDGNWVYPGRDSLGYVHNLATMVWWGADFDRYGTGTGTWRWDCDAKREVVADTFEDTILINGSKAVPCLTADIFGDWREEVLLPSTDNKTLKLYVSTNSTPYKLHTFLQDPPYRESVAHEQNGYNQPTEPGFYFGTDLHGHRMWFRGQYLE